MQRKLEKNSVILDRKDFPAYDTQSHECIYKSPHLKSLNQSISHAARGFFLLLKMRGLLINQHYRSAQHYFSIPVISVIFRPSWVSPLWFGDFREKQQGQILNGDRGLICFAFPTNFLQKIKTDSHACAASTHLWVELVNFSVNAKQF